MKIVFHQNFKKSYKKRISNNQKVLRRVAKRIALFEKDPQNPMLKDHALTGAKRDHRAFSVTGDIRVIYIVKDLETIDLPRRYQAKLLHKS